MNHRGIGGRGARARAGKLGLIALVWLLALLPAAGVQAQSYGSFRLPPRMPQVDSAGASMPNLSAASEGAPKLIIVDTDTGVDDAAALAWLFEEMKKNSRKGILGIVTVAGNTTVENATKNVLLLLQKSGWRESFWPNVYMGADEPLERELSSTGTVIHGTDGLGYARFAQSDWDPSQYRSHVKRNARSFYCTGAAGKDVTIVALGPLTNIAKAVNKCPDVMKNYRYVVLGGAKGGGNQTPVAEYNFWQDDFAAQIVLSAGLPDITIVPLNEFEKFTLTLAEVESLLQETPSDSTQDVVAEALCWYVSLQVNPDFGIFEAPVPDPMAMMYALYPDRFKYSWLPVESSTSADVLVEVLRKPDLVHGQSVIGFDYPFLEAVTMSADEKEVNEIIDENMDGVTNAFQAFSALDTIIYPSFYALQAEAPPNALLAVNLDGDAMSRAFLAAFDTSGTGSTCLDRWGWRASSVSRTNASGMDQEIDPVEHGVYLPLLSR